MSYTAMAWARSIKTGSPTTKAVLLAVANYADEDGMCWPSQEQLAEDTELSRHSVMRAMDTLEAASLLKRARRHRGDGSRTSDRITLDLSSSLQRSTEQRSTDLCSTQQQPKSHSATAEPVIEPSIDKTSLSVPAPKRQRGTYPADLEAFWTAYPTDPLMSKKQTAEAWGKLPPEDRLKAMAAVPAFKAHCQKNPDYRVLHAVRFLSQRRFEGFEPQTITVTSPKRSMVLEGTPAWEAQKRANPRLTARDLKDEHGRFIGRGWYFDTEYPEERSAA